MFWSPSRKAPSVTLILELQSVEDSAGCAGEWSRTASEVRIADLESLHTVEALEARLSSALEAAAGTCPATAATALRVVSVRLESAVANCSLPDALRGGKLWGSGVLAAWSDGLQSIRTLGGNDDVDSLFVGGRMHAFGGLKRLDLSGSNLSSLSGSELLGLTGLEHLDLSDNSLAILPRELGSLPNLKTLVCQRNSLTILPGELGHLGQLERLDLRSNRLSSILISFAKMKNLVHLDVDDNPLSAFPDLSPCTRLRSLAFASVRIEDRVCGEEGAEEGGEAGCRVKSRGLSVVTSVVTSFDRQQSSKSLVINFWGAPKECNPVQEFFDLALKGSTHHPLIIRGLATMISSRELKKAFLENAQALEKVALMLLSECEEVVTNACRVIGILSMYDRGTADRILNSHGDILLSLVLDEGARLDVQHGGLGDEPDLAARVLAGLETMETITRFASLTDHHQLEEKLVQWAISMAGWEDEVAMQPGPGPAGEAGPHSGHSERLKVTLLRIIGNLCCGDRRASSGQASWRDLPEFAAFVDKVRVYNENGCGVSPVSLSIKRLTSMLGMHDPPRHPGGVRVLSLDGGGMKGLSTIRLLRGIEHAAKRPLQEIFDLVIGTSTGALLAVALMVKGMSLDECEAVYKEVGNKVFKNPLHSAESKDSEDGNGNKAAETSESWANVLYRSLHMKTEHVRAVVVGCKHDTSTYEEILKDRCSMEHVGSYAIESMIDTSALGVPKIALVSALTSISPVEPFIFRNYEYSRDAPLDMTRMGSCSHAVWEAVRASSAATYYLVRTTRPLRLFAHPPLIIFLSRSSDTLLAPIHRTASSAAGKRLWTGRSSPTTHRWWPSRRPIAFGPMKRFDYCYPSASDQRQAANGRNLCRHTSTLALRCWRALPTSKRFTVRWR